MLGSAVVYSGLVVTCTGLLAVIRPLPGLRLDTRLRGLMLGGAGLCAAAGGLLLPAFESRTLAATTRLDEFAPAWQFHEVHTIRIASPPDRVFDAIKQVRADEIVLFRTLTWIRRAGRPLPPGIMNAGSQEPLLDIATKGGFVWLADDRPHEVVVGTVVVAPAGYRRAMLTPRFFKDPLPAGFATVAMNFRGDGGRTERVHRSRPRPGSLPATPPRDGGSPRTGASSIRAAPSSGACGSGPSDTARRARRGNIPGRCVTMTRARRAAHGSADARGVRRHSTTSARAPGARPREARSTPLWLTPTRCNTPRSTAARRNRTWRT